MALRDTFTRVLFLAFLAFALADPIPDVDYDAVIVGGGPAGLSALSALGRVRRTALMYDSGEYRNGPTRHMHDVIGNDGMPFYLPCRLCHCGNLTVDYRHRAGRVSRARA